MRRFLATSLEPAGWRLVQATTAAEGLALAMQYVRRKLEPERDGRLFATEAGVGYRLRED